MGTATALEAEVSCRAGLRESSRFPVEVCELSGLHAPRTRARLHLREAPVCRRFHVASKLGESESGLGFLYPEGGEVVAHETRRAVGREAVERRRLRFGRTGIAPTPTREELDSPQHARLQVFAAALLLVDLRTSSATHDARRCVHALTVAAAAAPGREAHSISPSSTRPVRLLQHVNRAPHSRMPLPRRHGDLPRAHRPCRVRRA